MKNFKKILIILITTLIFSTFAFSEERTYPSGHNTGSFYITCYKCEDHYKRTHTGCYKCYAWRDYKMAKEIDGNKYVCYKCSHGHMLWVSATSSDRK